MNFKSIFKVEFKDFLVLRKAILSESAYAHDVLYLESFDIHLVKYDLREKEIFENIVIEWIKSLSGKSSTVANKVIVIRIFLRYLTGIGIKVYIPPIPKVIDDYVPYIFSDEELKAIFTLADNIPFSKRRSNPYIQFEFPMMFRLMYGCGLRVGETLVLRMENVDLEGGILTLLYTKGNKQRLVPMHETLTMILKKYCMAMGIMGESDALLFPTAVKESSLSVRAAREMFNTILETAQITVKEREKWQRGPCLHCLRHVFSFKSFIEAEKSGRLLDDSIPYLSIYLGHDSLKETEHYLKFSNELYPEAMELFENYTLEVFPKVIYDE